MGRHTVNSQRDQANKSLGPGSRVEYPKQGQKHQMSKTQEGQRQTGNKTWEEQTK